MGVLSESLKQVRRQQTFFMQFSFRKVRLMISVFSDSLGLTIRTLSLATLVLLLCVDRSSATTLSSFENDYTTAIAADIIPGGNSQSFTTDGATDGTYALQINHPNTWNTILSQDGGTELAELVATYDFVSYDVTVPSTAEWRQVFFIMQGDGLNWNQRGGDVPVGTSTVTWDLAAEGYKGGLTSSSTWAQLIMTAQGGDAGGPSEIATTIDNIRFWNVPEPATLGILSVTFGTLGLLRRR